MSVAFEGKAREAAIYDALVEAEHTAFGGEAGSLQDKIDRSNNLSAGKRERAVIKKSRVEAAQISRDARQAASLKEQMRGEPEPEKPFRRIKVKGNIPKDAELGQGLTKQVNERIYPFKISGEYQMSWGYDWGDADSEGSRGMWKNADFNDANLVYVLDNQYIFGNDRGEYIR